MAPTVPIDFVGQKQSKKCLIPQMMGKSRKYSKGHSSGFVPDYQYVVETMAESEGFGSWGGVDMEMTAYEEDSCVPKRKCISLNADGYDSFGVPLQLLTLSKMSRSERKSLELKLKTELEQVRVLQKKAVCLSSNVVLSPSSGIQSCSDGQKRPSLESFHGPSKVWAPKGRKRAPPGRNGTQTKRINSGCFESAKPAAAAANTSSAMLMKQCENLLSRLMSHQFGWVFNTPVDVVKFNIPDYFNVIKHPMDLGTVKNKIASGQYSSPLGFAADVCLTFSNAITYNPPGNDVHFMAETLSKYFELRWKAIEKKLPAATDIPDLPSRAGAGTESAAMKKKKVSPNENKFRPEPVGRVMTNEEKRILSTELEALLEELPESIIDFLKEHSAGDIGEENELEIDIDALSDDTLFALRKLLADYSLEKQQKQAKSEPCEIEILNESGFSNSSMQLGKGNGLIDQDVDIAGGNGPPINNITSVEIEKDAAHRNSECSSSSSSSSESGSSSSDSDSSYSSESDAAKASLPASATKENLGLGANLDEKISDTGAPDIGNSSVDGLDQVELKSQAKPTAVELDGHQEGKHNHLEDCMVISSDCNIIGESAPSERQVSPEKLYRAALLRNRFADTILKAREKAFEKGEKCDPEKLRMEREELERQQREEKARLQAEAKAAAEAQRKAESEAAAEARRKRELEREAARQVLQKMEQSVEINENSDFMKDLEMLRTVQDEHLPNFTEEASPEYSRNGLGSFKFQGNVNPLEQLGLYMKIDDDEEEEVEPPKRVKEPTKDVEEGEID